MSQVGLFLTKVMYVTKSFFRSTHLDGSLPHCENGLRALAKTLFIVAIWIRCRKIFQELDQLGERVGDGAVSRLSKHAVALSYLGYVVIYELTFMHRR